MTYYIDPSNNTLFVVIQREINGSHIILEHVNGKYIGHKFGVSIWNISQYLQICPEIKAQLLREE